MKYLRDIFDIRIDFSQNLLKVNQTKNNQIVNQYIYWMSELRNAV